MLVEIRCDSFALENRSISFHGGLNVILGSNHGSNAIGKSTFLWIIDYAFGGDKYSSIWRETQKYIGTSPVFFAFAFDGQMQYFYRTIDEPRQVCSCDKAGHLIKKMSLDEYHMLLYENYQIEVAGVSFGEITSRYFRIYGGDNTSEKTPYLVKPKEQDSKAVDFLLRLSGANDLLVKIRRVEEEYGIRSYGSISEPLVDTDKINQNQTTIASLQQRLDKLMTQADDSELAFFGFDSESFEQLQKLQKNLRTLVKRRNGLQSQLNSMIDVQPFSAANMEEEFQELQTFFPQAELKSFMEIEHFHMRLREILGSQVSEEVQRLTSLISACDTEINAIREKMKDSGLAREMSERVVSQCVNISRSIDRYREENETLIHQKEMQDARRAAQAQMNELLSEQQEKIEETTAEINARMKRINNSVTDGQETAPVLTITTDKEMTFHTPGNTSEGTAFKSMVIYDLALAELYPIPALIHDSNLLKRIDDTHLEHILQRYTTLGRQVFIAFDKADSATKTAETLLEEAAVLRLDDEHLLFGKSWSKNK